MSKTSTGGAFLGGLLLGSLVGAVLALMFAPVPGSEARSRLGEQGLVLRQRAEDVASRIVHRDGAAEPMVDMQPAPVMAPAEPLAGA